MRKKVCIGDLGTIITGNTPPRNRPELYGNHTPFIKATDISESEKYTYNPEECYSEEGYNKYIKSLIPKGSTCVVTIGSIGKKMTMAHCDLFINQAMNAIIPNACFDSEYVYYAVKNVLGNIKTLDSGTASGRENVSKSAFSKMEIWVEEELPIQQRIATILSRYDSLIENYQKQINLLEESAQRLYKEWFIDLRFPGHENTKIVDGVPEGWKKKKIFELGKVITGKTPSTANKANYGGDIPFITIPDMHSGIYPISSQTLSKQGADSQLGKYVPENSLLVSCIGTAGLVCISEALCQTNQQINSLVLDNAIKLYYMYFTFLSLKEHLNNIGSNGATMTNVNKSKFENIEVVIPVDSLLFAFNSIANNTFFKIKNLSHQIHHLTESRDRLLPKLMSGEIEV